MSWEVRGCNYTRYGCDYSLGHGNDARLRGGRDPEQTILDFLGDVDQTEIWEYQKKNVFMRNSSYCCSAS